jgi:transcription antitermination factor NusG
VTNNQENKELSLGSFFVFLKNSRRLNDSSMTEKAIRSLKKHLNGKDPGFEDLTEPVIKAWIDAILPKLTTATLIRYMESLGQLYKHAVRLGYIADTDVFDSVREYVEGMCNEGFDKISQRLIDTVRKLASVRRTNPPCMGYAIDVYLYSFYHAGLDIDKIIELQDDSQLCQMPQTDAIKSKYDAPRRKYIFPLDQWQKSTKQNKALVERNFKNYLHIHAIKVGGRTNEEFIANAWVAAAKSCGISNADICACCPQVVNNSKLQGVVPSDLTQAQIDDIKCRVANVIVDMVPHWYAIRFVGADKKVRTDVQDICDTTPYKLYYPIEEIYKKTKKKIVVESRPTIRNILFIQTTACTINRIELAKIEQKSFHVLRNHARKNRTFAIIPNKEMHTFSALVSDGTDIIGEDELRDVEIIEGCYVEITEGLNKGYRGKVLKVRNRDNSKATLLQIKASICPNLSEVLKEMYITIRPEFVKCLKEIPEDTTK